MNKVPFQYFILTIAVIAECILFIIGWQTVCDDGSSWVKQNGKYIVIDVVKGSSADQAGLKNGDIILSFQNKSPKIYSYWYSLYDLVPGGTGKYEILRDNKKLNISIKGISIWSQNKSFFILYYLLISIVILIGLFVLFKNPKEKSTRIFFLFSQVFAICLNNTLFIPDLLGLIRTIIFSSAFPFLGTLLVHFFLLFPNKTELKGKFKYLIPSLYIISSLAAMLLIINFLFFYHNKNIHADFLAMSSVRIALFWMGTTLLSAILISLNKFFTIKEIVAHNQMRWVMHGVVFGLLAETFFGLFPQYFWKLEELYPFISDIIWALGTIILLLCFSFAIIRFHIWEIEIIIKKGLLYSILTGLLIFVYLLFLWITETYFEQSKESSHIIGIIFSALAFIPAREILQKRIDKLFHRENYDPTTAVLNFENSLLGKYDFDVLINEISIQIDKIFHFQSFGFLIKEKEQYNQFEVCCKIGDTKNFHNNKIRFPDEILSRIQTGSSFAVNELSQTPDNLIINGAEIITPLIYENKLFGCFLCGSKKSNRFYTLQDIETLNLLANRAATILQISVLYKSELEKQTLIERERLRISKDMHDEVGSSLTKIALLSDLIQSKTSDKEKIQTTITKISEISREVVDNISEIIWAINPKNDKLDNLAAYIREYVSEFLDGTNITPKFEFMENIPSTNLSAEYRRNLFLIVKEAINNVVKHSGASEIKMKLIVTGKKLIITIYDNGIGFAVEENSKFGNGLGNMEKRISEIEGRLEINSKPGEGTEIKIETNLS
ncbi:MAG: ATP-binding protein [Ignavibacteriaceae bacterium]